MIKIRKSNERGKSESDWLDSFHSFSFADYYDPDFNHFGSLRVINEDFIEPAKGFGTHSHHDMEIISYVVDGEMEHKDSLGNGSLIKPGEIQRMTAGTGVRHSEFNHHASRQLHLLQIWIIPNKSGLPPSYEQKKIRPTSDELILIGSELGDEQSVSIHQNVKLFVAHLRQSKAIDYSIKPERQLWLQLIKGQLQLNNQVLTAGDGAAVFDENRITIISDQDAEFLLFDL